MFNFQSEPQRRLKNSFNERFIIGYHIALPVSKIRLKSIQNRFQTFNTLSLQNVNQIESSADLKPAVYHEPENESEQKVTVIKVQQVQHQVEMRTSASGACFWFRLLIVFLILLSLAIIVCLKFEL